MDEMVFGFPDVQTRNLVGRAVRRAGFECRGAGPSTTVRSACLLTVVEPQPPRRKAVADLILSTAPNATRVR